MMGECQATATSEEARETRETQQTEDAAVCRQKKSGISNATEHWRQSHRPKTMN